MTMRRLSETKQKNGMSLHWKSGQYFTTNFMKENIFVLCTQEYALFTFIMRIIIMTPAFFSYLSIILTIKEFQTENFF